MVEYENTDVKKCDSVRSTRLIVIVCILCAVIVTIYCANKRQIEPMYEDTLSGEWVMVQNKLCTEMPVL